MFLPTGMGRGLENLWIDTQRSVFMKLGNILICLNDMDSLGALLETGCALALKHDAHLTGVFIIPAIQVYPVYEGIAMAEIFEGPHQKYEDMAADVQKQF